MLNCHCFCSPRVLFAGISLVFLSGAAASEAIAAVQCVEALQPAGLETSTAYRPRRNQQGIDYCEGETVIPFVGKGLRCRPIGLYFSRDMGKPKPDDHWNVTWDPAENGLRTYVIRAESTNSEVSYRLDCEGAFVDHSFAWPCGVMAEIIRRGQRMMSLDRVHMAVSVKEDSGQMVLIPARISTGEKVAKSTDKIQLIMLVAGGYQVDKVKFDPLPTADSDATGEPIEHEYTQFVDPRVDGACTIYLRDKSSVSDQEGDNAIPIPFDGNKWRVTPYLSSGNGDPKAMDSFLIKLPRRQQQ